MSDITQAAANIRALANQFRAVIALGDQLDAIGVVDQLLAEKQKQLDSILESIKASNEVHGHVLVDLDIANETLDEYNEELLNVAFDANDYRVNVEAASIEASTIIIEQAKRDAQAIAEHAAKVYADSVDIAAKVIAKIEERDAVQKQIDDTKAQLRALVS